MFYMKKTQTNRLTGYLNFVNQPEHIPPKFIIFEKCVQKYTHLSLLNLIKRLFQLFILGRGLCQN